jgi:flagellar assembly protein FliH
MSKEFEPYHIDENSGVFSAWEYKGPKSEHVEISKEQKFLNECEQIKQEAIDKGYKEGMQRAQEEIKVEKEEMLKWIELLQKPVKLLDDKLTQEIIQTVVWLSQYCIGIELSVNPEKLQDLLKAIKEELPSLKGNKLFVMHPDDVDWIKTHIHENEISGLHDVLSADPSLNRGDFYLKSEHSELDGRLQSRFITLFAKYIDKEDLITPIENQE